MSSTTPEFHADAPSAAGAPARGQGADSQAAGAEVREALTPTVTHPKQVQEHIAYLSALTEREYQQSLADNIMDEDPAETAAFYSDELVERTLLAATFLLQDVQSAMIRREGESNKAWQHRARFFRNQVGVARRRAQVVVDGLRARQGRVSNAPNPRARAARQLQRENPQRYLELVRHFEQVIAEEKRARKAAARAARAARARSDDATE